MPQPRTLAWITAALVYRTWSRRRSDRRAEQRHAVACHLVDVARVHRLYSEGEWPR